MLPATLRLEEYLRGRHEDHNGGDVSVCPLNLAVRATELQEIDASPIEKPPLRHPRCTPTPFAGRLSAGARGRQAALAAEEQAVGELVTDQAGSTVVRDAPSDKPRLDPTWAPPLTGQPWTGVDICQCVLPSHPHPRPLTHIDRRRADEKKVPQRRCRVDGMGGVLSNADTRTNRMIFNRCGQKEAHDHQQLSFHGVFF